MKWKWLFSFLMCGLLLTGCKTISNVKSGFNDLIEEDITQLELSVPQRTLVDSKKVPSHSRFVIAAIVEQMRDRGKRIKQVAFDKAGRHTLRDPSFNYAGFDLVLLDIGGYRLIENTKKRTVVRMDGVMHFADDIGRACSNTFAVRYEMRPGRAINIRESAVRHVTPAFPLVRAYFVPAGKIASSRGKLKTFHDFYKMAVDSAVPMRATAAEIAAREKEKELSTWQKFKKASLAEVAADEYVILVFCMERLAPAAEFKVKVTAQETVHGNPLAQTVYMNDAGWRIAAMGATAKLNSKADKFYVYATYEPDQSNLEKPILVGKFSSLKDYGDQTKAQQVAGQQGTTDGAGLGPLSSGKVLLNPDNRSDAVKIQQRLADLGFYRSKVDGLFGKGSRAALAAFRQDAGLGNNGRWDLATQKTLFQGSGQ